MNILPILKAFIPELVKHGVEMTKDRGVLKENLKSKSTKAAIVPAVIAAAAAVSPEVIPTDPDVTQVVMSVLTVLMFLLRKYQVTTPS